MFETNNFTAIDNKITPNTFCKTDISPGPKILSRAPAFLRTT